MFRNQYDTDITTWSPDGKLYQVDYAEEAVKQGSCAVGMKNKRYVAVGSLKRAPHQSLSAFQGKLFEISPTVGVAVAGLAADGRVLTKFMRRECLQYDYLYSSPLNVTRLVEKVSAKSIKNTQRTGRRAYGVGMLVAGVSNAHTPDAEVHLFETKPSGLAFEYRGFAIGARSQSARTYIEKNLDEILGGDTLEQLIVHILKGLKKTTTENVTVSLRNAEVVVVGVDHDYHIYDDLHNTELLSRCLEILEREEEAGQEGMDVDAPAAEGEEDEPAAAVPPATGDAAPPADGDQDGDQDGAQMDVDG